MAENSLYSEHTIGIHYFMRSVVESSIQITKFCRRISRKQQVQRMTRKKSDYCNSNNSRDREIPAVVAVSWSSFWSSFFTIIREFGKWRNGTTRRFAA